MTWKELVFIWYAGMIRGAIAFGLVLRVDDSFPNRKLIVTTCLALVVFTTVFFGSTVGMISHCMFKNEADEEEADEQHDDDKSDHSEFIHPNFIEKFDGESANDFSSAAAEGEK